MYEDIANRFIEVLPAGVDFCSLRLVHQVDELLTVRQNVVQPVRRSDDLGAMVTVCHGGGLGYAASSDLSKAGLAAAMSSAQRWAESTRGRCVVDFSEIDYPHPTGSYSGPCEQPWGELSVGEKLELLQRESERLKIDERIVDWEASLWHTDYETLYLTNGGGRVEQRYVQLAPMLSATANAGAQTQTRSLGSRGYCRQGGVEVLSQVGFQQLAPKLAEDALTLLAADNCPSESMDLVLAPDQMLLQIHESIGHPLELDRILGDERNYAGDQLCHQRDVWQLSLWL